MSFADDVIAAVTGHMNGDHPEDNLLIVRAFGAPDAVSSRMVGVTGEAGVWLVADAAGEREVSIPWPGGSISERPQIRREVVALYNAACEKLGVPRARSTAALRPTAMRTATATPTRTAPRRAGMPRRSPRRRARSRSPR